MSDAAVGLGSGRKTLSPVIHGQSGISPAPKLKLESITWGSARLWLWRQANYDLEHARRRAEREEAERASLEAVAASGLRPLLRLAPWWDRSDQIVDTRRGGSHALRTGRGLSASRVCPTPPRSACSPVQPAGRHPALRKQRPYWSRPAPVKARGRVGIAGVHATGGGRHKKICDRRAPASVRS